MYVIRHPYDPGPDKLDNYAPRPKRGWNADETAVPIGYDHAAVLEASDPRLWKLDSGRWTRKKKERLGHG